MTRYFIFDSFTNSFYGVRELKGKVHIFPSIDAILKNPLKCEAYGFKDEFRAVASIIDHPKDYWHSDCTYMLKVVKVEGIDAYFTFSRTVSLKKLKRTSKWKSFFKSTDKSFSTNAEETYVCDRLNLEDIYKD